MNEARCTELVRERARSPLQGVDLPWVHPDTLLCEFCGRRPGRERHHRYNRSQGGLWTPSNIVLLCREDHGDVTVNPRAGSVSGLHLAWSDDPLRSPVRVWYSHDPVLFDDEGGWSPLVDKG